MDCLERALMDYASQTTRSPTTSYSIANKSTVEAIHLSEVFKLEADTLNLTSPGTGSLLHQIL